MRRTIGNKSVSEQRLEEILSGMVAATAVPGAAYDWQGRWRRAIESFAERPTDQVRLRISAQYSQPLASPPAGTDCQPWSFQRRIQDPPSAPRTSATIHPFRRILQTVGGTQYFVAPVFGGRTHQQLCGSVSHRHVRDRLRRHTPARLASPSSAWRAPIRPTAVLSLSTGSGPGGFLQPQLRWSLNDGFWWTAFRGTRFGAPGGYLFHEPEAIRSSTEQHVQL
jgi:hypothetical protein